MMMKCFLAAAIVLPAFAVSASDAVTGLRTCRLVAPQNVTAPVFSWKMTSDRTGAAQKSYAITLTQGGKDVWKSGTVASGLSTGIAYTGPALAPATAYAWSVAVTDERGKKIVSSPAPFATGLSAADWTGSAWITLADPIEKGDMSASRFRGTFRNAKDVHEARWFVTGCGVFTPYVNGREAGGDFLRPGFTHAYKCRHAFGYDVTALMNRKAGAANEFSAAVTAGWWRDKITGWRGKDSAFRAQLVVRYTDGTEDRFGTSTKWWGRKDPSWKAAIFNGETFDARGRATAEMPVRTTDEFKGEIRMLVGPGVTVRRDRALEAKRMYVYSRVEGATADAYGRVVVDREIPAGGTVELRPGETLIADFAQNAAGVPEFTFSAAPGTVVACEPSEFLNDGNGAKARGNDGPEGSVYRRNYRSAEHTSKAVYTFADAKETVYMPTHTFFGYQYVSVTANGPVKIRRVRSLPVSSVHAEDETGTIATRDASIDRLIANGVWGHYSNYLSVPTDCPQRDERLGWSADTQVFAKTACYNADSYGFLSKWLEDLVDTQLEDGNFTGVAPLAQYGSDIGGVGWSDAAYIVAYNLWTMYGDKTIVEKIWPALERNMRTLDGQMGPPARPWGDWLAYEKNDADLMAYLARAFWVWDAEMMTVMAEGLGKTEDAARYRAMRAKAAAQFKREFLDAEGLVAAKYRCQCAYLYALKLGLVEGAARAKTVAMLRENIHAHGDKLQTGFLGTAIIMDALVDAGCADVAYTLLFQRGNPSWLYSVDQGATTYWERWNSYTKETGFGDAGMNSFNHYAYGAVVSWMYGSIAGIREDPAAPGFKHFVLAPVFDASGRLPGVDAAFESPYGTIRSAWTRASGGAYTWSFTVPANTTATVVLPSGEKKEYAAGAYTLAVRP